MQAPLRSRHQRPIVNRTAMLPDIIYLLFCIQNGIRDTTMCSIRTIIFKWSQNIKKKMERFLSDFLRAAAPNDLHEATIEPKLYTALSFQTWRELFFLVRTI